MMHCYPNLENEENKQAFKEYANTSFELKTDPFGVPVKKVVGLKEAFCTLAKYPSLKECRVYWGHYCFKLNDDHNVVIPQMK